MFKRIHSFRGNFDSGLRSAILWTFRAI